MAFLRRLLLLLALPAAAFAQGMRYDNIVLKPLAAGGVTPVSGALITVCTSAGTGTPCTPKVSNIYSNEALTAALTGTGGAGTTNSDANGNFGFYASPGSYVVTVTGTGITSYTINVTLPIGAANAAVSTNCQLNGELYVGTGITCWAGSDIGAQINTVYAACPATGCRIHILPGAYSFTTPVVATTVGKNLKLLGPMEGAAVLTYTPTTGIAITVAGGSGNNGGVQLEDFSLVGSGNGNPTTGIQLGSGANGISGATLKNLQIGGPTGASQGFGSGVVFSSSSANAYLATFINNHIQGHTTGIVLAGEGNQFFGGVIGNNITGVTCANASQDTFNQVSFDDNTTVAVNVSNNNCRLTFSPSHFENAAGGTEFYLTQSAGFTSFFGADGFQSDTAGGTAAQFATISGGHIEYQAGICAPSTRTVTQMFNLSGSTNAILRPRVHVSSVCSATGLATIFNAAYTGGLVIADAEVAGNNANTGLSAIKGSIPQLPDLIGTEGSGVTWRIRENAGNLDFFNGSSVAVRGSLLAGGGFVPGAAAVGDLGSTSLPWANLWIGTAATNNLKFQPSAMAAARVLTIPDPLGAVTMPYVIANGTTTLTANATLAAVTSQAANTTAATNALTTDSIEWAFATAPGAGDNLCHVLAYVTAGNVNFVRTNPTAAAQNVSAIVINWRVIR